MLDFSKQPIKDFINILEANLNIFMMGKIPKPSTKSYLRPNELSKFYKFSFNNGVSPNLKYDAIKKNIFIFVSQSIEASIECNKCKEVNKANGPITCTKCHSDIGFTYVSVLNQDYLGLFIPKKCRLICIKPSKFQFSCKSCQSNYESDSVGIGKSFSLKCYECFSTLYFKIEKIILIEKKDVKITPGVELPDKGTCKHYKKSYRWFRFFCIISM